MGCYVLFRLILAMVNLYSLHKISEFDPMWGVGWWGVVGVEARVILGQICVVIYANPVIWVVLFLR